MHPTASLLCALFTAALVGCATAPPQTVGAGQATGEQVGTPLEAWSVVLVTAKSVPRLGEVRDLSDAFTYEGRIFAHATFVAPSGTDGGKPLVEVRWLNGDRVISVQKAQPVVDKSPYYMAVSTSGTALGVGKCKVEYTINGKVVAAKEFSVSAQ